MSFEMNVIYSSLFDAVFANSFFSPMRTVYVVSDSQLEKSSVTKEKKNSKISRLLVRGWKRVIKLESRCLINVSMNFKRRSKLLLQRRRRRRKSMLN